MCEKKDSVSKDEEKDDGIPTVTIELGFGSMKLFDIPDIIEQEEKLGKHKERPIPKLPDLSKDR
jgi:hypothetical protein